ncbi:MAG: hypothetical protein V7K17_06555 [Nostoc sp.]
MCCIHRRVAASRRVRELLYSPKKKRSHSSFYLKLSAIAIGFPKSKEIITIFINWHLPN